MAIFVPVTFILLFAFQFQLTEQAGNKYGHYKTHESGDEQFNLTEQAGNMFGLFKTHKPGENQTMQWVQDMVFSKRPVHPDLENPGSDKARTTPGPEIDDPITSPLVALQWVQDLVSSPRVMYAHIEVDIANAAGKYFNYTLSPKYHQAKSATIMNITQTNYYVSLRSIDLCIGLELSVNFYDNSDSLIETRVLNRENMCGPTGIDFCDYCLDNEMSNDTMTRSGAVDYCQQRGFNMLLPDPFYVKINTGRYFRNKVYTEWGILPNMGVWSTLTRPNSTTTAFECCDGYGIPSVASALDYDFLCAKFMFFGMHVSDCNATNRVVCTNSPENTVFLTTSVQSLGPTI